MADIADQLTGPERTEVLAAALNATTNADDGTKPWALSTLALKLNEDQLSAALRIAEQLDFELYRLKALAAVRDMARDRTGCRH